MGVVALVTPRLVFIPLMFGEDSLKRYTIEFFYFQLISSCKSAWSRIQYSKKQNKVCLIKSDYTTYFSVFKKYD